MHPIYQQKPLWAMSNLSIDDHQIVQVKHRDLFILVQLVVSSLLVLMQLCVIPVFLYADLRRRILYRIMLSIALSDFLQLFAIWLFTLFEFYGFTDWPMAIEKFASAVYIIAWDHLITQHFLLALNRLIIILRAYYSPTSHKKADSRAELWVFNFLLLISWVLLLALTILFMTPLCGGTWDKVAVGFFYDSTLKCSDIYEVSELYFTIVFPALSVLFYMGIVFMLKKSRKVGLVARMGQNGQQQQQQQQMLLSSQEKRILVLSVVLFAVITALIFSWYLNYRQPPWTLLFCAYLLVNTSLTLAMNSEFRNRFLQMMFAVYKGAWNASCCPSKQNSEGGTEVVEMTAGRFAGGKMKGMISATGKGALFVRRTGNAPPTRGVSTLRSQQ